MLAVYSLPRAAYTLTLCSCIVPCPTPCSRIVPVLCGVHVYALLTPCPPIEAYTCTPCARRTHVRRAHLMSPNRGVHMYTVRPAAYAAGSVAVQYFARRTPAYAAMTSPHPPPQARTRRRFRKNARGVRVYAAAHGASGQWDRGVSAAKPSTPCRSTPRSPRRTPVRSVAVYAATGGVRRDYINKNEYIFTRIRGVDVYAVA